MGFSAFHCTALHHCTARSCLLHTSCTSSHCLFLHHTSFSTVCLCGLVTFIMMTDVDSQTTLDGHWPMCVACPSALGPFTHHYYVVPTATAIHNDSNNVCAQCVQCDRSSHCTTLHTSPGLPSHTCTALHTLLHCCTLHSHCPPTSHCVHLTYIPGPHLSQCANVKQ